MSEKKTSPEVEKPAFLFHASNNRDVAIFEPRDEKVRDPNEGIVVFATPSKSYASMFLVRDDDSWSHKGRFGNIWYTVISDRDRFEKIDQGGVIYTLPSDTFVTNQELSMGTMEWVSKLPVKPTRKEEFSSGLQAMIENGVQVFFVDDDTWKQILESDDHGYGILSRKISENERLGINFNPLEG